MRVFAGVALACALTATQAAAERPFTIEDQLSIQDFGRVAFSPDGRWLVAERYGRWKDAPTFDHEFLDHQTSSRIFVTDLSTDGPPRPLLAEDRKAGDTFGAFSPDGARVLVFRQKGHRREMGVAALATGAVMWSGLTADPEVWSAQVRWRNTHQVVLIARAPDAPSILLGAGWQTQARTQEAWAAMGRGEYSGVTLGAARYAGLNPPPPDYSLTLFDITTGRSRVLAVGAFFEMLISPDGRTVAVSQEGELTQPDASLPVVRFSSPHRRRRLTLVDLDTGAVKRPCPQCDLAPGTWAWSPDGKTLVAAARDRPGFDASYGYWRFDARGAAAALAPELRVNLVVGGGISNLTGQVAWLGGDPIILAKAEGGQRPDWWKITAHGPANLTGAFSPPQGRALAFDSHGVLLNSASGLVRLSPDGRARVLVPPSIAWQSARTLPGASSDQIIGKFEDGGRVMTPDGRMQSAAAVPTSARLMATSRNGYVAAIVKDAHGLKTLTVYRPKAAPRPLLTINRELADVAFAQPVPIHHEGARGAALTSWLYLPPEHKIGDDRPLIIVPYAGDRYDQPLGRFEPGSVSPLTNVQLMVAKGYAVLVPSLPVGLDDEPSAGLADAILAVVDAAHAQHPEFSPNRLAVWGHSYGGWTTLMAGAQSPRFKALIASAPTTDLVTMHSSLRLASFAVPEVYMTLTGMQGWAEGGQGRMGGPPWAALDRYVRNSPLLQADKITAPVMLIYGDMDFDPTQVAAMFESLSRQGKDVQLLFYRGEGHVVVNPANLRDLHQRAFAFLADALGPVAPPSTPKVGGGGVAASPAIRPSQ
ncbi:prolyl oligopeptidase family serine peptidase [Caulobacter sp. FWC2]|uniref:prolyl oligopeptidase family serine peptidase n=1 Tax=Caulobacter sp. FWC2 TaxID=69664 RepID=UPI00117792C7|nr:prolyl oligopeptidase family serine peptidase [Caulobacter sp. FWC2]